MDTTYEMLACQRCGYVRKVKVHDYGNGRFYAVYCTACDKIAAAQKHERQARKLRFDAVAILQRRKQKEQK